MRMTLSIVLTALGLVAIYLFASGAAAGFTWNVEGLERAVNEALRPFTRLDLVSALALGAGTGLFVAGLLVAPRSDLWVAVAPSEPTRAIERQVMRSAGAAGREKTVEIALALNVFVVAAILALLGVSIVRESSPRALGALFVAGALEALVGTGLLVYLVVQRRRTARRVFRPLLAASAGIHILEVFCMISVLALGCFGSS